MTKRPGQSEQIPVKNNFPRIHTQTHNISPHGTAFRGLSRESIQSGGGSQQVTANLLILKEKALAFTLEYLFCFFHRISWFDFPDMYVLFMIFYFDNIKKEKEKKKKRRRIEEL